MKIKKPKVYIISRPVFEAIGVDRYLFDNALNWNKDEYSTDAEKIIEVSGRICYRSFTDDKSKMRFPNSEYIKNLIVQGHESVLEHINWTFILDGVSRSFTHQLVRHRIGFSYSQLSQQYHDESDAEVIMPMGLSELHPAYSPWRDAVSGMLSAYRSLIHSDIEGGPEGGRERLRWIRSIARSLLPNAVSTTIAVTANARALRHFFEVRGSIEGDYEMREICSLLLAEISKDAPSVFDDFKIEKHADGAFIVRKKK